MPLKKKNNRFSTLILYFELLKKWGKEQKYNFILANILMIIVAICTAMYPLAIDFAFDTINEKKVSNFYFIPVFVIALTLIKGFAYYFQTLLVGKISNSVIKNIQFNLYKKIINFDVLMLNEYKAGSLQSRFINDLNVLKEAIIRILNNLVRDFFTLVGLIISMIYLDWLLTLCVIFIYPICIKPIISIGKTIRKNSFNLQEKVSLTSAFLNESFSSIRVIKTFNLERLHLRKALEKFNQIYINNVKIIKTRAKIEPTLEIIGGVAVSIVIIVAGIRITSGASDIGAFSGFISALLIAVQPARALGTLNTILQEGAASLLRIEQISIKTNNIKSPRKAKEIKNFKGKIIFKNVHFSYDNKKNVLNGLDCEIKAKEKVVIVGANGSGKSTLVNLIPRLFDPTYGEIKIDGINIKDLKIEKLRSKIALVSQDIVLFDTTIKNNILIANQHAVDKEISNACKLADADFFIGGLKNGYNTVVGERGLNLSGGQRQKVAIARAILKRPKIFLFDEATSALDINSEKNINKTIQLLSKSVTTLLIAHKMETIIKAERVLFLKEGKISGDGKHEDLIKKNKFYREHINTNFNKL
mgnify:CR=1 FL=1